MPIRRSRTVTPSVLGQNFLVNPGIAEKIVECFLPVTGPVLEIGPGRGVLTERLVRDVGPFPLAVVDVDQGLLAELQQRFGDQVAQGDMRIIARDILEVDPGGVFPGQPVNIIGNVPYYISGPLIDWAAKHRGSAQKFLFMMQKEFVDKITDGGQDHANQKKTDQKKTNQKNHKKAGARSVMFNLLFRWKKHFDVRPGSFNPPPRVTSTVFSFEPDFTVFGADEAGGAAEFYEFLRVCFHNRRKRLTANLAAAGVLPDRGVLSNMPGWSPGARAEQLTTTDFLDIYRRLYGRR